MKTRSDHSLNLFLVVPAWLNFSAALVNKTKFLVSKEPVVLRRWEIETEIDFIKR